MRLNCIATAKSRVVFTPFSAPFLPSIGFIFAIFQLGCHPLPPGDLNAVAQMHASSRIGQVYLIRGWRDLWSEGIDTLAGELREHGLEAQVYRAAQWRELAEKINASPTRPLVLIGFSYGADDVIEVSRKIHQQVDLLITIDPVTPPIVPANVQHCDNFYQTNGVWDAFPWLRGIPLQSEIPERLANVDLRKSRPDLVEPDTSHSTIAANAKLHQEILGKVMAVCPQK